MRFPNQSARKFKLEKLNSRRSRHRIEKKQKPHSSTEMLIRIHFHPQRCIKVAVCVNVVRTASQIEHSCMCVCVYVLEYRIQQKRENVKRQMKKKSKEEFFWGYYESCDWRDCHVFGSSAFVSVRSHFLHQQFSKSRTQRN